MTAEKRKNRGEKNNHRQLKSLKRGKDTKKKNEANEGRYKKKTGPRLPSKLVKEINLRNHTLINNDEEIDSDEEALDIYEYEEAVAEEDTKKNKRFDTVENYDCEFAEDDSDESIPSDVDVVGGEYDGSEKLEHPDDESDDDDDDEGRHGRMLQGITGLPLETFESKKKKNEHVIYEAYPEDEFNPTRDVLDGDGHISIEELLKPLDGKPGYSKLRKDAQKLEKKSTIVHAPLPKADREKLERKVAYEFSKKDVTKWEPLVKRNREAPTVFFDDDIDLGFSTIGAIASEFQPRTDFEKKMASLNRDERIMEAHRKDGSKLLELNKISVEEVKERHNQLAKMRSLLFRHEMKAKHIKKIKSKTYHRLLKKDRLKAVVSSEMQLDPEAAKEEAIKQEFKRAEERMTLKHKNKSKWAKRMLQRGLDVIDEGTRAAIAEQLHQHALLTRKMQTMNDNSSSDDDSSDGVDDDDVSGGSDQDSKAKLLTRAKEKTRKVMEGDDTMPNSGIYTLPFMERGMKKRKEEADEEARLALQEYETSLKELDGTTGGHVSKEHVLSGRRVFGAPQKKVEKSKTRPKREVNYGSDSDEDDFKTNENTDTNDDIPKNVDIDVNFLRDESEIGHDSLFKSFSEIVKNPGPTTAYDVAIIATDLKKKIKNKNEASQNTKSEQMAIQPALPKQDLEEEDSEGSGSESDGQMVDGILTSATKPGFELPSQAELVRRAFAGDDVEEDFEKDKLELLNEENPEPEKPTLVPGWGEWSNVQRKKGLPSWMVREHQMAKKKREEALMKRKDAHLKNVIISERMDKKAEKLHTKTLPFPYTSKEVFEQSIRMPIGPEYNPASTIGALNRPEVVKRPGVIIKPIQFEDVNPHEKAEERAHGNSKQKTKKRKSSGGKNQLRVKKRGKD